jgi:hypothetical protein
LRGFFIRFAPEISITWEQMHRQQEPMRQQQALQQEPMRQQQVLEQQVRQQVQVLVLVLLFCRKRTKQLQR